MADIELFFGNVTTRGQGSLNVVALYKKTARDRQLPVASAVMDPKSDVVSLGLVDKKNSSTTNRPGQWIKTRVKIPEGSFVEFQMMRSRAGGGFGGSTSAFVIRARSDGPLHRISVDFPVDEHSTESRGYIEGRFDILKPDEIEALGVNCLKHMEDYDPEEYSDHVEVTLLEREFRPKAIVKKAVIKTNTTDGSGPKAEGKKVLRVRRIRRLNVGN